MTANDNLARGAKPAVIAAVASGYLWYLAVTLSHVESVVFAAVAGLMIGASYANGAMVRSKSGAVFTGTLTFATMIVAQYFIDRHIINEAYASYLGRAHDLAWWIGFSDAYRMIKASASDSLSEVLSWLAAVGVAVWVSLRGTNRFRYWTR